ncbi:MAG TPA: hypothetical protein VED46_15225 [Alphaproteobacteria bacterium]|nr:hypothetical protein [Alphaproteobacteria bacterium]
MALSRRSIATLLDLVEIKLSCIEVVDREDHREFKTLRACREELLLMLERQQARILPARPTTADGIQPSLS